MRLIHTVTDHVKKKQSAIVDAEVIMCQVNRYEQSTLHPFLTLTALVEKSNPFTAGAEMPLDVKNARNRMTAEEVSARMRHQKVM